MDPFAFLTGGQGGLSIPSSATAYTGAQTAGGFHFAPKSSTIPPVAWIALAAAAVVIALAWRRG